MEEAKLFVGSLSYQVEEKKIRELFSEFGLIKSILHFKDKGFAFVEFNSRKESELAKNTLDGTELLGRKMNIDYARPKKKY